MFKRKFKKLLACAASLTLAVTGLVGGSSLSANAADAVLVTNGTFSSASTQSSIYGDTAANFYGYDSYEFTYQYTTLSDTADYSKTFCYVVYDTAWGGWQTVYSGPTDADGNTVTSPQTGVTYYSTMSIDTIKAAYTSGGTIAGINIGVPAEAGGAVMSVSQLVRKEAIIPGFETTISGSWTKGTAGGITSVTPSSVLVDANEWNIGISQFSTNGFSNPTIEVTANYAAATSNTQAEILINGSPIDPNYISVSAGTHTFTTELPANTNAVTVCYDACTITNIRIYNNIAGDTTNSVTNQTASDISPNMGPAWNLGNSLESLDASGNVGNEKSWGNAKTTKKLIQAVKNSGFNALRVPVSMLNKITGTGASATIDTAWLDRVQEVVDYAYDLGMYVILDAVHGDGSTGIANKWIDISSTNNTDMIAKYSAVWTQIANRFANYDQKVIFESMNEVMIDYSYSASPDPAYANINALNQAFVNAVRGATGSNNDDRILIIPGYNTNIDLTITSTGTVQFVKPTDTTPNKLILSVHYYDPYDFALNENSSEANWGSEAEKDYMYGQIEKIYNFADALSMPVFIGEYGPIDKNNTSARANYCYWLNCYASEFNMSTAYWDNGVIGTNGSALFDRIDNVATATGSTIITSIFNGYNGL